MKIKSSFGIVLTLVLTALLGSGCASSGAVDAEKAIAEDAVIARDVRDAIRENPELQDQGIVVRSEGGVVTLIGEVESSIERRLAVRVAEVVPGVVSIQNELTTQ